jgi:cytochrome P450
VSIGSDTTSSTLAAVIHYLLHHPEWLASATKEIRSTYTSDEDILLDSTLSSCKVFLACVDETQRLTPTAPNGPPREVDAGGIVITGHHLAQGTNVSSPIYHLQREEQYFDSPNRFKPDRWIVHEESAAEDEERIKHQRKAHMPFHIGPRSCKLNFYIPLSSRDHISCSPSALQHSPRRISNVRCLKVPAGD